MDLGKCPKCGAEWTAGYEKCLECGFVAIGAGLKHLPKKERPKPGKYEEPGSWGPAIRGSLVLSLLYFGIVERPWANSWSYVRTLLGQPMPFSVEGDWDVVRAVRTKTGKTVFVGRPYASARAFFKDGKVVLNFAIHGGQQELVGKYSQSGPTVQLRDVQAQASTVQFPDALTLNVVSSDETTVTVEIGGTEAVTLLRRGNPDAPSMTLAQFDATGNQAGTTMAMVTPAGGRS